MHHIGPEFLVDYRETRREKPNFSLLFASGKGHSGARYEILGHPPLIAGDTNADMSSRRISTPSSLRLSRPISASASTSRRIVLSVLPV